MVRRKWYQARMKGSMVEHINYVRTIADQLESLNDRVSEKDLVMVLLSSLPDHYNTLLTTLETLDEERLTWQYVRDRLLTNAGSIALLCSHDILKMHYCCVTSRTGE